MEITRDVFAGPMCMDCLAEHVKSMARKSGETDDIPIFRVITTPKAIERISVNHRNRPSIDRSVQKVKSNVRMF
jgi:hypothetical protein